MSLPAPDRACFDVVQQSLNLITLGSLAVGSALNVERAAKDGAEVGGHPLSGHIDCLGTVVGIREPENNRVLRIAVPASHMRYVFAKGYIAVNGASLTVAEADRRAGWFEVWLIPETLRMTTFVHKAVGDRLHIEIERSTQVVVDTVRDALEERLGPLLPALEKLLALQGQTVDDLGGGSGCQVVDRAGHAGGAADPGLGQIGGGPGHAVELVCAGRGRPGLSAVSQHLAADPAAGRKLTAGVRPRGRVVGTWSLMHRTGYGPAPNCVAPMPTTALSTSVSGRREPC